MKKDFEELIALQEIDLRIHGLEMSKIEFPHQVTEHEAAIAKAQADLDAANAMAAKLHEEVRAIHQREAEAREALDKSQIRLGSITTNREYDAVHAEIEAHKGVLAASGDRIAAVQKQIERCTEAVSKAQEALAAVKTQLEPVIADLKEKIATIDSRIANAAQERAAIEARLPKHILAQYAFIRKRRKNARVLSLVADGRTCAECHKILEPRLINELKRGAKLSTCTNCGSLLIWTAPVTPLPDAPPPPQEDAAESSEASAPKPAVDAAAEPEIDDEPIDLIANIEDLATGAEER